MLKKIFKGMFYVIVMIGSIWAAEGFTEMIGDEIVRRLNQGYNFFGAIERIFKSDPEALGLYLVLIFALIYTTFEFGKKTLTLVRKEKRES